MDDLESVEERISDGKAHLGGMTLSSLEFIPTDFFNGNPRLIKAINGAEDYKVSVNESEAEIRFDAPAYVSEIRLTMDIFESAKHWKVIAKDLLSGKDEKVIATPSEKDKVFIFSVKSLITSFVIHRKGSWAKNVRNIRVAGFRMADVMAFESQYVSLTQARKDLLGLVDSKEKIINARALDVAEQTEALHASQSVVQDEVEVIKAELVSLETKKTELTRQTDILDELLKTKQAALQEEQLRNEQLSKSNRAVASELEQNSQKLTAANVSIANAEGKLRGLVNNINVFSEEFSGFVEQGTVQIQRYMLLAFVPLLIFCILVYNLFHGAVDLTTKFSEIPKMDLLTLFVTRIPFVAISALIIGVCVKIFFFLVNRIILIHQQRLDLAKIAIIAKDVSDASAMDSGLSESQIYEEKTYLKMAILRAYLAEQVDKFSYRKRSNSEAPVTDAENFSPAPE